MGDHYPDDLNRKDDEANDEDADIDFTYNDTDIYYVEIAEFYSHTEEPEFKLNQTCFEKTYNKHVRWFSLSVAERRSHITVLMDRLESGDRVVRLEACRAILYLVQGNLGECDLEEDQALRARCNVYTLIDTGILSIMIQTLLLDIGFAEWSASDTTQETAAAPTLTVMSDCEYLRVVLSVLYVLVETVRDGISSPTGLMHSAGWSYAHETSESQIREQFVEELDSPVSPDNDSTLASILFSMVERFCDDVGSHFPIKKTLYLLWKVLLVTLGPLTQLFGRRNAARARFDLPPLTENTYELIKRVRSSSPPAPMMSSVPRMRAAGSRCTDYSRGFEQTRSGSLADLHPRRRLLLKRTTAAAAPSQPSAAPVMPGTPMPSDSEDSEVDEETTVNASSMSSTPSTCEMTTDFENLNLQPHLPLSSDDRVIPWRPKARMKDIEEFVTTARLKYVGFAVPNDTTSLTGLPAPIGEAVRILRDHLHVSLAEVQAKHERRVALSPLVMMNDRLPDTPTERLYRLIYTQLPKYEIALLRILLSATPTYQTKPEQKLLAEMMPERRPETTLESAILEFEIGRHRELIVKAISSILLLLLKHFKLNHIHQFEYAAYHLVHANCIPLILKFFNQELQYYIQSRNTLSFLDFPSRHIGKPSEITPEQLMSDWNSYSWRNMFACINLLRILNMIVKWKPSRVIFLAFYNSAAILKKVLHVRHPMLQLYVLKLLKMQSHYCGRAWRKTNMPIISAIYQKVRHRLTDNWAYGNDMDPKTCQSQVEEAAILNNVNLFNQRRYTDRWLHPDFQPVNNSLISLLSQPCELSDDFKTNYRQWLEEEVFSTPINWSQVLSAIE